MRAYLDKEWVSLVKAHPYKVTIVETVEKCPTCGTECYVHKETEQQGSLGGARAEYWPLEAV